MERIAAMEDSPRYPKLFTLTAIHQHPLPHR